MGILCKTLACFYAGAAVNWFENKVNQFTAARTLYEPGLHKAVHVAGNAREALVSREIFYKYLFYEETEQK